MPTRYPRLNVVLEPMVMEAVGRLAARDGVSRSMKARELIRESLELQEDAYLAQRAEERIKTFDRKKALTHERVWAHLKRRRRS